MILSFKNFLKIPGSWSNFCQDLMKSYKMFYLTRKLKFLRFFLSKIFRFVQDLKIFVKYFLQDPASFLSWKIYLILCFFFQDIKIIGGIFLSGSCKIFCLKELPNLWVFSCSRIKVLFNQDVWGDFLKDCRILAWFSTIRMLNLKFLQDWTKS
jgi:hypothetical protein